jgi:hypothetical protein
MQNPFIRFWRAAKGIITDRNELLLERSYGGRLLSAVTYITITLFLALWITIFLLIKDRLIMQTLSGEILTDLTCITFFGGLVIAIILGALAGNFLRRAFYKIWVRRRS